MATFPESGQKFCNLLKILEKTKRLPFLPKILIIRIMKNKVQRETQRQMRESLKDNQACVVSIKLRMKELRDQIKSIRHELTANREVLEDYKNKVMMDRVSLKSLRVNAKMEREKTKADKKAQKIFKIRQKLAQLEEVA